MIRAGLGLAVAGWFLYQLGATQVGGWTLVAGVPLVVLGCKLMARYKTVTVRTEGGHGPRYTAKHEVGHRKVAKYYGVKVGESWIEKDGSGSTELLIRRDTDLDPNVRGAIADAGRLAEGVGRGHPGCRSDQRNVKAAVRCGGDRKTMEQMAAVALRGGLGRDVDRLMKQGRL